MRDFCIRCNKQLTIDEVELSKGKYCFEHAARAYKWAMIKAFEERDELIRLLNKNGIDPTKTERK